MLGPLLFLTFINDVCESSRILSLILFADDTNLFYSDKNVSTLVNTVNQALEKVWSGYSYQQISLSLNVTETHYIVFKSKRKSNLRICQLN